MTPIQKQLDGWYSKPMLITVSIGAVALIVEIGWMLWVILNGN